MSKTPPHLGGHANVTHIDEGALRYFWEKGCRSMLDIGCGPGGQVKLARTLGYEAHGIDGDANCCPDTLHDFNTGRCPLDRCRDLVWMVEFLEHISAEVAEHVAYTVWNSWPDYILITHALPGAAGHHHVNCQPPEYWEGFFAAIGYLPDDDITAEVKAASTMKREFIQRTGRVYVRAS